MRQQVRAAPLWLEHPSPALARPLWPDHHRGAFCITAVCAIRLLCQTRNNTSTVAARSGVRTAVVSTRDTGRAVLVPRRAHAWASRPEDGGK